MKLKIDKNGDDLSIVLPKELISDLHWDHGDILEGTVENGALTIVRVQTAHGHATQIARKIMKQYRATLEALAKS